VQRHEKWHGRFRPFGCLVREYWPSGVKKLRGKGRQVFYRLRVGDHRVIYQVNDVAVLVLVIRIGDRKEIYRLEL
jgi:mRNA interferase RelE/StbE